MERLYCLITLYCIVGSTFSCVWGTYFSWHGTLFMTYSAFAIIYGGYLTICSAKLCKCSRITIVCCANHVICNTNNIIYSQCVDTSGAILISVYRLLSNSVFSGNHSEDRRKYFDHRNEKCNEYNVKTMHMIKIPPHVFKHCLYILSFELQLRVHI